MQGPSSDYRNDDGILKISAQAEVVNVKFSLNMHWAEMHKQWFKEKTKPILKKS